MKSRSLVVIILIAAALGLFLFSQKKNYTGVALLQEKIKNCNGIPNDSTIEVVDTTRKFINFPRDVYPGGNLSDLQFSTVSGNATAGWISNAGPPGEAFQATPNCWSYYYEFDGSGEVALRVKSKVAEIPDYQIRVKVIGLK
ncbi:MAG TPA: hypothetical protein VEK36_00515 [Candidatus Paceibacterota bacterium]|nr:hypothetical protein [Candidatus Paceibacterota bacterium]